MLHRRAASGTGKRLAATALLAMTLLLSGCVAAALPIAAAGLYGGKQLIGRDLGERAPPIGRSALSRGSIRDGETLKLLDLTALPEPDSRNQQLASSPALPGDAIEGADYLAAFIEQAGRGQQAGEIGQSVVLMPDTDPASPQVTLCDGLPYAFLVMLDRQAAAGSSDDMFPVLLDAVETAREAGLTVLFSIDAPRTDADIIAAALAQSGLGPVAHGSTLWLVGDRGTGDSDALRWKIASNYCVVAMIGHRPTDFSLIYGRYPDESLRASSIGSLWNAGWFLSSEPLAIPAQTGQSLEQNAAMPASAANGERQ